MKASFQFPKCAILKNVVTSAGVFITLLISSALAAPQPYEFNDTHTTITASWNHWGYSRQSIEFTNYEGLLLLDFENPTASKIEVTIHLANKDYWVGAPQNDRFENHLASADLFDINVFSDIKFIATSFETDDRINGVMHGDLTIKGQTHPVSLNVRLNKMGINRDRHRAGFSARAEINRSLWGMGFGAPDVPHEIEITIETELVGPATKE